MTDDSYPQNKEELMSEIDREWTALMHVVDRLSPERMITPDSGGWSPRDNLAHLSEWMKVLLGYHLEGRPSHEVMDVDVEVVKDWDFDVINKVLFERNRNRPSDEILEELKTTYDAVLYRLKSTSFDDLLKPRFPNDPSSYPVLASVAGNTYEHFAEHREMIERGQRPHS